MSSGRAVKAVALFEAFKGMLVISAASGLLLNIHEDVHAAATRLIEHLHLNPASKYPRIFIDVAANVHDSQLALLAAGAVAYSVLRFVEAYGLFHEAAWAEVLAALSGAVYLPFEGINLWRGFTWLSLSALSVNLMVVALMTAMLIRRNRRQTASVGSTLSSVKGGLVETGRLSDL